MPLEMTVKTVFEVDYSDLDNFIEEVYGHQYEIVGAEECGNYCSKTYNIKKEALDDYDVKRLNEFIANGKYQYLSPNVLLTDCCNRDLIPAGEYLIDIFW